MAENSENEQATEETAVAKVNASEAAAAKSGRTGRRAEKVGIVASDKMQKTVVVRVDRLVRHPKYRRYVRRTSKFMAHDEKGATIGDKVRIAETRPLSARKRWNVVEIIQKAEK
jgi:small subunit ribosomal protein S17